MGDATGAFADAPSRQLARTIADVAALHELAVCPTLVFRPDRFLRGGDHTAFNEQGFAAVRFTEVAENDDRQHQDVRAAAGGTTAICRPTSPASTWRRWPTWPTHRPRPGTRR